MKVWIRSANSRDVTNLESFSKRLLPETYTKSFWEVTLAENKNKFSYVAEISKVLVGYIFANNSYVISFAVEPKYRNQGIGKLLLLHFLKDVSTETNLHVEVENKNAQKLYQSVGFQIKELKKNYYQRRKKDAYWMIRPYSRMDCVLPCKIKIKKIQ